MCRSILVRVLKFEVALLLLLASCTPGGDTTWGYGGIVWTTLAPMPTPRESLGVAVGGTGKLYAIGGLGIDGGVLDTVEEYDPETNRWRARASMPTPRSSLGVATAQNGKIYAIGGYEDNLFDVLDTVEEYDPETNRWRARANMPTPRARLAVVAASNGKIYAIGGRVNPPEPALDTSDTVEEYDPETNRWRARANMPTPREMLGAAFVEGRIYAIGGWNLRDGTPTTIDVYELSKDSWSTVRRRLPEEFVERMGLAAVGAQNGRIYAMGGKGHGDDFYSTIWWFDGKDPESDTWGPYEMPMQVARWNLGAASFGNRIYAVGGSQQISYGGRWTFFATLEEALLVPDLVIHSLSVDRTQVPAGGNARASVTIANQGEDQAAPSQTRFLLSLEDKNQRSDDDLLLDGILYVPQLAPGETYYGPTDVTVPLGIVPGSYWFRVCADYAEDVQEDAEFNNCKRYRGRQFTVQ